MSTTTIVLSSCSLQITYSNLIKNLKRDEIMAFISLPKLCCNNIDQSISGRPFCGENFMVRVWWTPSKGKK